MRRWFSLTVVWLMLMCPAGAWAQPTQAQQNAVDKAYEEAQKVQQTGPAEVTLLDQAKLKLPAHYIYVPQPQAGKLMQSFGNPDNSNLVGLIMSDNDDDTWVVTVDYQKTGYIKDDDAKSWDVDELFKNVKEGTEEDNKQRRKEGFPEIEIIGWVEKPQYDAQRHHLIWSISHKDKGAAGTDASKQTINYNTYVLGREGYLTLTLITGLKDIAAQKPIAAQLLNATEFVPGKRYEDYNKSTDKTAEYGLAALIAGVAAKKLGLFALIAAFAAKFAKVIIVAVIGLGAAVRKFFTRNKKEDVTHHDQTM